MMKNLKKSEIVVYVVALMIVTAGYFNYTATDSNNLVETYSEDIQKLDETANTGVGDAVLVSNNEVDSTKDNNETQKDNNISEIEDGKGTENVALVENDNIVNETLENSIEKKSDLENVSDTKNTKGLSEKNEESFSISTSTNINENNYYANSKLEREKMYANMLSTYQTILNNENVSETQKGIASKEITKINNTKNSIMICENLIMTKGFNNCIILINEDSVNIVVNVKDGLTAEKVAQIQNIISREIGTDVENIHIMEK